MLLRFSHVDLLILQLFLAAAQKRLHQGFPPRFNVPYTFEACRIWEKKTLLPF